MVRALLLVLVVTCALPVDAQTTDSWGTSIPRCRQNRPYALRHVQSRCVDDDSFAIPGTVVSLPLPTTSASGGLRCPESVIRRGVYARRRPSTQSRH